jgi:hypothetical protein
VIGAAMDFGEFCARRAGAVANDQVGDLDVPPAHGSSRE